MYMTAIHPPQGIDSLQISFPLNLYGEQVVVVVSIRARGVVVVAVLIITMMTMMMMIMMTPTAATATAVTAASSVSSNDKALPMVFVASCCTNIMRID
jgi:hypothetical protein